MLRLIDLDLGCKTLSCFDGNALEAKPESVEVIDGIGRTKVMVQQVFSETRPVSLGIFQEVAGLRL